MSKRLGRVERKVIELLDKKPGLKGSEVVTAIAGTSSKPSEKFAIRRALASLQGKGFLDKTTGSDGPRWARSEPAPTDVHPLVLAIHQCEDRLRAVARAKLVLREREAQLATCMASLRPKIEAAGRDYFEFCKRILGMNRAAVERIQRKASP
jgi:hypothetical protein